MGSSDTARGRGGPSARSCTRSWIRPWGRPRRAASPSRGRRSAADTTQEQTELRRRGVSTLPTWPLKAALIFKFAGTRGPRGRIWTSKDPLSPPLSLLTQVGGAAPGPTRLLTPLFALVGQGHPDGHAWWGMGWNSLSPPRLWVRPRAQPASLPPSLRSWLKGHPGRPGQLGAEDGVGGARCLSARTLACPTGGDCCYREHPTCLGRLCKFASG